MPEDMIDIRSDRSVRIEYCLIIDQIIIPINIKSDEISNIYFRNNIMTQITAFEERGGALYVLCSIAKIELKCSSFIDVQGLKFGFVNHITSKRILNSYLNIRKSFAKMGHMAYVFNGESVSKNINASDIIADENPGIQPSGSAVMRFAASNNLTGKCAMRLTLYDYHQLSDFAFASCSNSVGLFSSTGDLKITRITVYKSGKKIRCLNEDFNLILEDSTFIGECPNVDDKVTTENMRCLAEGNPIQYRYSIRRSLNQCRSLSKLIIYHFLINLLNT